MRDIRWRHACRAPTVAGMTNVAVLGTGRMGAPITGRLLAAGHDVTVWNRTPERAVTLAEAGARVAGSPAEAVAKAEVVITMLTDGRAVEAVLFGPGGAAAALAPGACLVEMSTIGPDAVAAVARALPDGIDLVDAPVAGGVGAARSGQLVVLAGGADAAVDRAAPVLAALGTLRRCGGPGAGAAMKLVLNTGLVTAVTALADALAVARALGVQRDAALDALAAGPLGIAVQRFTGGAGGFAVSLAAKDAALALAALGDEPAPVVRGAAEALRAADPDADLTALVQAP
jgi:3-hydroxyisobutyrate dehydrogenase